MRNYAQLLTEINASRPFLEAKKLAAYKTDKLTSKMWILPDGDIVSLDQWHYRWILGNKSRVAKFGLDTTDLPDDERPVRIAALKKGFFRVNYEHNRGNIIIEGLKSKFSGGAKRAVFKIAMDNIDMIDRMKLTLVDDSIERVLVNREVVLFSIPDEQEKLAKVEELIGY